MGCGASKKVAADGKGSGAHQTTATSAEGGADAAASNRVTQFSATDSPEKYRKADGGVPSPGLRIGGGDTGPPPPKFKLGGLGGTTGQSNEGESGLKVGGADSPEVVTELVQAMADLYFSPQGGSGSSRGTLVSVLSIIGQRAMSVHCQLGEALFYFSLAERYSGGSDNAVGVGVEGSGDTCSGDMC